MAILDGKRVRVRYRNKVRGHFIKFTAVCSGCTDERENVTCYIGGGCYECGYTGKRVQRMWLPLNMAHFDKAIATKEKTNGIK